MLEEDQVFIVVIINEGGADVDLHASMNEVRSSIWVAEQQLAVNEWLETQPETGDYIEFGVGFVSRRI